MPGVQLKKQNSIFVSFSLQARSDMEHRRDPVGLSSHSRFGGLRVSIFVDRGPMLIGGREIWNVFELRTPPGNGECRERCAGQDRQLRRLVAI